MAEAIRGRTVCVLFLAWGICMPAFAAVDPVAEEYRTATAGIAPLLVRIETIGGRAVRDKLLAAEGATTGLLVDGSGLIVTSALHFLHEPSSILVRFSVGPRLPAVKVATDFNRMLTLLKVEQTDQIPESLRNIRLRPAPPSERRLGQTVIAVGWTLSETEPNITVGILSGTDRIWGKAIQTDAAVGPNNYGGPLIDRHGGILGLLVPLSMTSNRVVAGYEMYDGGVGMAIPLTDVLEQVLPNLLPGKDRETGETGLSFHENTIFIGLPRLARVLDDSPAAKAGLLAGDLILALDGRPVKTAMDVVKHFKLRYAGETVHITIRRTLPETKEPVEKTVSFVTVPARELLKTAVEKTAGKNDEVN